MILVNIGKLLLVTNMLPPAFSDRMKARLGEEWNAFLNAYSSPGPISIRDNPRKKNSIQGSSMPWSQYGKYLSERPSFTLDPTFHAGAYYVQEASSMFLEHVYKNVLDLNQPLVALDLCAAPGGKSTHLVSLLSEESLLVSNEVIRSRASILAENIQKWGYPNVVVTNNDPEEFNSLSGFFDLIVIDAPCSGEGLFRKDQAAMQEWSPQNVELCSQRQRRIISDVWPSLKEDGILIYSTCTFSEEENENNLTWLSQQKEIEFVSLPLSSESGIEKVTKGEAIGYRFYPHKVKGEGFFVSVIRKKETTVSHKIKYSKNFTHTSKKITDVVKNWFTREFDFIQQENLILALPKSSLDEIEFLSTRLKIVTKGTAVAELKHDKLIPEHAGALSIYFNKENFKAFELPLKDALSYLRKENISIGEGQKGFAIVTYGGNNLGWVNLLGNRVNNLYPSNWRIRMSN